MIPHSESTAAPAEQTPGQIALAARIVDDVKRAKKKWAKAFERMRADQKYARFGCDPEKWNPERKYVVPLIRMHVANKVNALYSKNPRPLARLRERLRYTLWDGQAASLMGAQQLVQGAMQAEQAMQAAQQAMMAGMPVAMPAMPDPAKVAQAQALLQEIAAVEADKDLYKRVGRTLEVLFSYYADQQGFKERMKEVVRRAVVCGVGYVRLDYQRQMQKRPETIERIQDVTARLAFIEAERKRVADGSVDSDSAEAERLRVALRQLQSEPEIVVQEGPLYDFPAPTQIIPSPGTRSLKGWLGTEWIAHEMMLDEQTVRELYGVEIDGKATPYAEGGLRLESDADQRPEARRYLVWQVWDKKTGTVCVVADGHKGFLSAPREPEVWLERFFPFYALTLNDVEDEHDVFPPSDAYLMRPAQEEYNRTREALRAHRRHHYPKYIGRHGVLDEEDKARLASAEPFSFTELKGLDKGESIDSVVQAFRHQNIDPNLYETGTVFDDLVRSVGTPESAFGSAPTSATATSQSIADQTRTSALQSNIDDLDAMLSDLARGFSQVALMELSVQEVKRIAGPGAVWPHLTRQQAADEVYLDVQVGSSGRPNAAADLAKWERATPVLMQLPGVNPEWVGRKYVEMLDPGVDFTEAFIPGGLSITAQNAAPQPGTGDPFTDPASQGAHGAFNDADPRPAGGRTYPMGPGDGNAPNGPQMPG